MLPSQNQWGYTLTYIPPLPPAKARLPVPCADGPRTASSTTHTLANARAHGSTSTSSHSTPRRRPNSPGSLNRHKRTNSASQCHHHAGFTTTAARPQAGIAAAEMVEIAIAAVGEEPTPTGGGDSTHECIRAPPPPKRRRLDYAGVAKMRLQEKGAADRGADGPNQQQIMSDLIEARKDLVFVRAQLEDATAQQGGTQVLDSFEGLTQATDAINIALAAQGDFDWQSDSWAATVSLLLEGADTLLEELDLLNFAHASDVNAFAEGAEERPTPRAGTVLRDIRGVLPFHTRGQPEVRAMLAYVAATFEQIVYMDTQSTEAGGTSLEPSSRR
ncbi:unnamed protein product [Symbiodinium sp. CCMP2592]|nr:unnamed protein product [Symbiodinium sp. CCMP2592]